MNPSYFPYISQPICRPSAFPLAGHVPAGEGRRRERLAAYFLSLPAGAPGCLDVHGQTLYRRMAERLNRLEIVSCLQAAGTRRVFHYGDAAAYLQAFAQAALVCCARRGIAFTVDIPESCLLLSMDPRLLMLSVGRLLHDAARGTEVAFRLIPKPYSILIAASGFPCFCSTTTQALLRETARLHRGTALFTSETAAFSMGYHAGQAVDFCVPPTVEELTQSPLSPVNLSLF